MKHIRQHIGQSLLLFTALQLLNATCPSCTVKESRDLCPCLLTLVYGEGSQGTDGSGISLRLLEKSDGHLRHLGDSTVIPGSDGSVSLYTGRGKLTALSVWPADISAAQPGSGEAWINIPVGEDCPGVWTGVTTADTRADVCTAYTPLHKNFCRLDIKMTGDISCTLTVRGNICGYDCDGCPLQGDFRAEAQLSDSGYRTLRIPRQTDSSLRLDIISPDGSTRTFAIGNYIEESGYTWDTEDLKDITMEINYASTSVTLSIGKWRETLHFDKEI